jgi:heat shock protein HtpX
MKLSPVRNVLKAWLLLLGFAGVLGLIGWQLGGYRLLSIFVFCALLVAVGAYWSADRAALGMVRARELLPGEAPSLHSTVERLSLRAGVVKPKLHVIPHGLPIALVVGRGPAGSSLAVSAGLLALPAPAEIEGVIAHELAHVRNRDVLVQTTAVVVAALIV